MNALLISICMPILGMTRWLPQAIYSILAQDYQNFELVVQDGSPSGPVDDDRSFARAFAALDGRLSYQAARDAGIFHAVNACLRRAKGDIMYFMCSDDLLCPGALEAVNDVFAHERFGGLCWLYGRTISAHVSGRTQGIDGDAATLKQMLVRNRIGSPAVFWNRQILSRTGGFDTRYRWAADYDLWLRFWRQCEPVFLNQTLGIFRHHAGQATEVNRRAVEDEAAAIAWRHTALRNVIVIARDILTARQVYGAAGIPGTVN